VLPVQYTQRKMQSATGGQLSWDLPVTLGPATNGMLKAASEAAAAGKTDEAISLAGGVAGDADMQTVCGGGHVALLTRQYSLASAMFREVVKRDAKQPCAALGLASAALMQGDVITAGKLFWDARDVGPGQSETRGRGRDWRPATDRRAEAVTLSTVHSRQSPVRMAASWNGRQSTVDGLRSSSRSRDDNLDLR
jgi:hypothetical protein